MSDTHAQSMRVEVSAFSVSICIKEIHTHVHVEEQAYAIHVSGRGMISRLSLVVNTLTVYTHVHTRTL